MCAGIVLVLPGFSPEPSDLPIQDSLATERALRTVAQGVVKDASFRLVDSKTGAEFTSTKDVPPNAQLMLRSRYTDWRYWNGVLNIAMLRLGEMLGEPSYAEFSRNNVKFAFDNYRYFEERYEGEGKWNYPFGQQFITEELDDCGAMGASVIEVYRHDPRKQYRDYIEHAAQHILHRQSRLPDGTLVRDFPQKWTLWTDDLYMGISFLARMGELSGDERYFDDAARQVFNFNKRVFDPIKGVMRHCWYSDTESGGVALWGRANGWAMLAQADLLDRLPKDHPSRDSLLILLRRHILGIAQYQAAEGLWHQLLDKSDSYLETSCTAMFTYAIARSVNKGYVQPRYATIARRGWEGVMTKIRPDGQVEGVCAGTSVSDDLVYYYRRHTPMNDIHGIGAVLLAGSEVMQLK
jgi:rhamnogalacturonyl hydrolase YesR